MAKWDNKETKEMIDTLSLPDHQIDLICASILLAAIIKTSTTRSAAPREAVLLLKELKKHHQENLGG